MVKRIVKRIFIYRYRYSTAQLTNRWRVNDYRANGQTLMSVLCRFTRESAQYAKSRTWTTKRKDSEDQYTHKTTENLTLFLIVILAGGQNFIFLFHWASLVSGRAGEAPVASCTVVHVDTLRSKYSASANSLISGAAHRSTCWLHLALSFLGAICVPDMMKVWEATRKNITCARQKVQSAPLLPVKVNADLFMSC